MKLIAFITLLLIAALTVQPIIGLARSAQATSCCSKVSCPKEKKADAGCANNSCNPFISCPYNTYFLPSPACISVIDSSSKKKNHFPGNDNRIVMHTSGIWHPPQI